MINSVTDIIRYALDKKIKLSLEQEKIIAKNAYVSYIYARDVLKGRFELGEKSILEKAETSYLYAKEILKARWEEAEYIISTDSESSFAYFKSILKTRFPRAEKVILNSKLAIEYIEKFKTRFPFFEKIATPENIFIYLSILGKRIKSCEKKIKIKRKLSFNYSLYIKTRFSKKLELSLKFDEIYIYTNKIIKFDHF